MNFSNSEPGDCFFMSFNYGFKKFPIFLKVRLSKSKICEWSLKTISCWLTAFGYSRLDAEIKEVY